VQAAGFIHPPIPHRNVKSQFAASRPPSTPPSVRKTDVRKVATFAGGSQTILGAWATVGSAPAGTTWAVSRSGALPGAVSGLGTFSSTLAAGQNVSIGTATTVSTGMIINSLRVTNPALVTHNINAPINIASGGLLYSGTTDVAFAGMGSFTAGNGEFMINNRSEVGGPDAAGTPGRGKVIMNNTANDFVGTVTIASGRLQSNSNSHFGNTANGFVILGTIGGGGQLFNNNFATARAFSLSGYGWPEGATSGSYGVIRACNTMSGPNRRILRNPPLASEPIAGKHTFVRGIWLILPIFAVC
jgi:hypothetical protein